MSERFYISTPIYYVNDVPHIGHTYTTIAADTMARYQRMCGKDTYFLTGTDEHGQKIEQAAQKRGMSPLQLADEVVQRYHKLWSLIGITNNDFIRTTEPRHKKIVQQVFQKLQAAGDIYAGDYEGWYCTPCEAFWTESQLGEGGLCPDCGRPTARMKEPTYFFRMSKYQDQLLAHIEANPNFIMPESRKNEIVSFIKEGLRDLSVSRTSFSWGVEVPNDPKHVIYVWIDALTNYISALGYDARIEPAGYVDDSLFKKYWPADFHLVGKDIVRFHTVYWPTMLMALGLPLPKHVFAHGWWTVEGQKMSKSLGNVVNPFQMIDTFGVDVVRYFLLREVTFGLDGDFSYKALIHRTNGDLANDLGNLVTRSLGMIGRYFDGIVPPADFCEQADEDIQALIIHTANEYHKYFAELAFNKVLASVWALVSALNKYIDEMQPWALAKDESKRNRLGMVLYTVADGLRAISNFIAPFMPDSAKKLRAQLGMSTEIAFADAVELANVNELKAGSKLGEVVALFPRLDEKEIMAKIQAEAAPVADKAAKDEKPQIAFDDFAKVNLVAGFVEDAERVPKSDKLLKLTVNDGKAKRIIVSGIAATYAPEDLKGKTLAFVENLKPVKLMGIQSNGMVLSATDAAGKHNLLFLPDGVPAGTIIK
ncbi:MAG: methionine--tRNA ligase [Deferribacteraceae bacterium]|jgi:methionyl-tRNA synthetase|nr:methionine--tRNA ligase [Deferribacteraceae bacterium]